MIICFDARFAQWQAVCRALVAFRHWRQQHSGYCYIRARAPLSSAIARLCTDLDLDEAWSFLADDEPGPPEALCLDLSAAWELPEPPS